MVYSPFGTSVTTYTNVYYGANGVAGVAHLDHPASHVTLWKSGGKFASGLNFKGGAFFSSGGRFFFLRGALFFPMKNA